MINKKEAWGYGLELAGFTLLIIAIILQLTLSSWDKQLSEQRYLLQEEVNLAVLSALNDIASIQSVDDKVFKETVAKNVTDTTNKAYSNTMNEKQRHAIGVREGQITTFQGIEILLIIVGVLFVLRGRWMSHQGIKERVRLE